MRTAFIVALLLGIVSCSPRQAAPATADPSYTTDAYCQIASTEGLFDWTGSALVACPGVMAAAGDGDIDGSACSVSTIAADGTAQATTLLNVRGAQVLSDGRILVWSFDGSLSLRSGTMSTTIADVALDPWLDAVRNRVAFVAPAIGAIDLDPGSDRRVVVYDIGTQTLIDIVDDATASSPVLVPGTDQVLYVSSSTGTTAVWRVMAPTPASSDPTPDSCTAGRQGDPMDPMNPCVPPDSTGSFTQITNLTPEIPQTIEPPFGRQHLFVGEADTLRLVYTAPVTAADGSLASEVFTLDPSTGDTMDLGPGAFPQRGPQGSVLARTGTTSCVAVQYLAPGAQP